ncbi:E3 ubiquitin-protein ligase znrf2-like [Aplochiton taeniatus]
MGGNQSSPETDGRTRAYSSSDVPSSSGGVAGFRYTNGPDGPQIRYTRGDLPSSYVGLSIPSNGRSGAHGLGRSLDDMDEESEMSGGGHRLLIGSLPAHLSTRLLGGFYCPVCSKYVVSNEVEQHLLMCLTKPRLSYNEDVLARDSGECAICLEELEQGDTIARLPCLCIYHKGCIDEWFDVNRSCPEHPSD